MELPAEPGESGGEAALSQDLERDLEAVGCLRSQHAGHAAAADLVDVDVGADVVAGAGGWLYDRVRAGWKVNVVVPVSCDVRPLEILGVQARHAGRDAGDLPAEPAALAVPARLFAADQGLRRHVTEALRRGTAEVTMWGPCATADVGYRVDRVQYRLSTAARAFKAYALAAAGITTAVANVEQFHSCALWYPSDGPDLTAVR